MFSMLRMLLHTLYPIEIPVRRCTSFIPEGDGMSSTAFILSGLASIPRWFTMKPRNFPVDTPKAHLAGFSFML